MLHDEHVCVLSSIVMPPLQDGRQDEFAACAEAWLPRDLVKVLFAPEPRCDQDSLHAASKVFPLYYSAVAMNVKMLDYDPWSTTSNNFQLEHARLGGLFCSSSIW